MTKINNDGYLDEIQERTDGDLFKAMLEVMARRFRGVPNIEWIGYDAARIGEAGATEQS